MPLASPAEAKFTPNGGIRMKSIEERRETIRQLIEELETLRPRIEAAGGSPTHYAYSKSRAVLKLLSRLLVATAIATIVVWAVFFPKLEVRANYPVSMLLFIVLACMVIAYALHGVTDMGAKTYVLASPKAARELEESLNQYREMVADFEQRKQEAEIYRPKFDQLYHIITCELKGTYAPHWQPERHFKVKIGFGKYKAEYYDLNRGHYAKLLARIIESRSEYDDQLTEFIQICERILQL